MASQPLPSESGALPAPHGLSSSRGHFRHRSLSCAAQVTHPHLHCGVVVPLALLCLPFLLRCNPSTSGPGATVSVSSAPRMEHLLRVPRTVAEQANTLSTGIQEATRLTASPLSHVWALKTDVRGTSHLAPRGAQVALRWAILDQQGLQRGRMSGGLHTVTQMSRKKEHSKTDRPRARQTQT